MVFVWRDEIFCWARLAFVADLWSVRLPTYVLDGPLFFVCGCPVKEPIRLRLNALTMQPFVLFGTRVNYVSMLMQLPSVR